MQGGYIEGTLAPGRRDLAEGARVSLLSHSMTVRPSMAAFSMGTSLESGPREITNPPTCWERWRGNPTISRTNRMSRAMTGFSGSSPISESPPSLLTEGMMPFPSHQ